jgi:large subunit ribosomal protein L37Ae
MAKRTEKAGTAGRYGARCGVVTRKTTRDIEAVERSKSECPTCHHMNVKRVSTGIWQCRHCDAKFAAASYTPTIKKITSKEVLAQKAQLSGGEQHV